MTNRILKSILPAALLAAVSVPAAAQVPMPPGPNFEIRIAHSSPPRLRHEHRPPRPGEGYVWIGGFWDWQGERYVWTPGRWDRPAEVGVTWVTPRYRREYGAYRYEPGHWSNQRVVEGDEYRHWREGHGRKNKDHDRDRDHDHDHQ
jgi:hypothetical protein